MPSEYNEPKQIRACPEETKDGGAKQKSRYFPAFNVYFHPTLSFGEFILVLRKVEG